MEGNLSSIRFDRYVPLIEKMFFGESAGFIVMDIKGNLVWNADSISDESAEHLRLLLVGHEDIFSQKCSLLTETKEAVIHVDSLPLTDISTQNKCGLLALVRHFSEPSTDTIHPSSGDPCHTDVLDIFANWMMDELLAYNELESMTLDLGERYEELNLLYSSHDDIDQASTAEDQLARLVTNCVNFIDVDLALLVLPEKRIRYAECSESFSENETQQFINGTVDDLIKATRNHRQPLVFNKSSDYESYSNLRNLGYRVISAPIYDGNNNIWGCLIVVRRTSSRDFTNSDRNLMYVLARKSSSVIQHSYDKLTGLLTRSSFESIIDGILTKPESVAIDRCLIVVNVDQLNIVNELHGLKAGDTLIKYFGHVLETELRNGDYVARLSGDEFGILANNCSTDYAKQLSLNLQSAIKRRPALWQAQRLNFTFRTGIVAVPHFSSGRYLLNAADAVMGITAKKGSGSIEVFRKDDEEIKIRSDNIKWVNKIHEALRDDRFRLVCQGIYAGDNTSSPHHYEVLIRMLDSSDNLISPMKFLTAAERYRLLPAIDQWVVTRTIKMLKPYAKEFVKEGITWAINLSGQSISNKDFRSFLLDTLNSAEIPPACLGFEVTESSTIDNISDAQELMDRVKSFGCSLYLDDFGTGLSTFSYMRMLPFDYVKIDGSFIKKMRTDSVSCAMVKAICDVAKAMTLKTVAEFVENSEDVAFLNDMGVDYLQGYFFHKPEDMQRVLERCVDVSSDKPPLTKVGR